MSLMLVPKSATDAEFLVVYNRLCVALREAADDSGITQGIYFEALKDLPTAAIDAGAMALMREPGRRFFPTSAEWRAAAESAQVAQLRDAVKPGRDVPWTHECAGCEDTGWTHHECDGSRLCGREKKHGAHSFVRVCYCRPTNRTYQRHQKFGAGE